MYRLWIKLGQIIWLAKSIQKLLNIWSITWCRIKMNFTLIMIQFKDVFNYFPIIWFLINEGWIFWFQSNFSHFSQKARYYLIFEPTSSRKFKPNINLKNICFNVQIIFLILMEAKLKSFSICFDFQKLKKYIHFHALKRIPTPIGLSLLWITNVNCCWIKLSISVNRFGDL